MKIVKLVADFALSSIAGSTVRESVRASLATLTDLVEILIVLAGFKLINGTNCCACSHLQVDLWNVCYQLIIETLIVTIETTLTLAKN